MLTFLLIGTLYINAANIVDLAPSNNGGCSVTYTRGYKTFIGNAYTSESCEQIAAKIGKVVRVGK